MLGKAKEIVLEYRFNRGSNGWLPGFTDYSLKTSDLRMLAELRPLPDELGSGRSGYFLQSMNRSDDVFMFLKVHVTGERGLEADREYRVAFDIHFATNTPSNCVGVGGSPGDSVYLKAGASVNEPVAVLEAGESQYVSISIDKGQQAVGGKDAGVVGTLANGTVCEGGPWQYVRVRKTYAHAEQVRTDSRGTLWVLVGTDSAFEGLTGLYIESITVRIYPAVEPANEVRKPIKGKV